MTHSAESIRQQLRRYVLENFLFTDDGGALDDDASFLQKGIVDSTGIMEVILFVEEEYRVSVRDDEMVPDNLDSIDNLVTFVQKKLGS